MARNTVPAEMAKIFGASNPQAFILAVVNRNVGLVRTIHNRVVARTGKHRYIVRDGKHRASLVASSPKGDTPARLLARIATVATQNNPSLYADEARRFAMGLPHGLDGEVYQMEVMPRAIFGVDDAVILAAIPVILPLILSAFPMLIEMGKDAFSVVTETVDGLVGPGTVTAETTPTAAAPDAEVVSESTVQKYGPLAAAFIILALLVRG